MNPKNMLICQYGKITYRKYIYRQFSEIHTGLPVKNICKDDNLKKFPMNYMKW